MLTAAFLLTLWLFIGSIIMLLMNERTPDGVSLSEFVQGMIAWPWWAFGSMLEIIRLLLVQ